jgi:hypothetical protein
VKSVEVELTGVFSPLFNVGLMYINGIISLQRLSETRSDDWYWIGNIACSDISKFTTH